MVRTEIEKMSYSKEESKQIYFECLAFVIDHFFIKERDKNTSPASLWNAKQKAKNMRKAVFQARG